MAVKAVVEIDVEIAKADADIAKLKAEIKALKNEAKETGKVLKDAGEKTTDSFKGSQAAADRLKGGLLGIAKQANIVRKAAIRGGKALRSAMTATGIGALIVALGYVVENWSEIVDFITGSNNELEDQINLF
jgi:hypothetical protein